MTTPRDDGPLFRLLFTPESAWPIAILRILIGIVIFGWAIAFMFDAGPLLGPDGPIPQDSAGDWLPWGPLALVTNQQVWLVLIALAVVAIPIIVGFRPTVFLLIAFVLMTAVGKHAPLIMNSGDFILRNVTFLLALTPSSAALSVDRWRKHGRAGLVTAPKVAPWGMRLIQLQMMCVYFIAFWSKSGYLWSEGVAVSSVFRVNSFQRIGAPDWLIENIPAIALLTWGTLALEVALALLLWNKRLRPVLVPLALSLHLFIDIFMMVGFFGVTMMSALMIFLDGDKIQHRISRKYAPEDAAVAEPRRALTTI